jgi:nucleotidyltransferase AbiEii toxin of type IV toxin-antitoxin system
MPTDYLHNHPQFADLIRIVAREKEVDPALVEKDYWIMYCLYGLQKLGLKFELKGGTSLSRGFQIISRFSEDIDIRIEPPPELHVKTGPNHKKLRHVESRKNFYDWLANTIRIDGIVKVERDTAFDDKQYRSGGIRLSYDGLNKLPPDLKEGVLLEVGFDVVTPNEARDISSWAYDYAATKVDIIDNRAKGVACYDPGHTFVEKLQTVSTKVRQQQEKKGSPIDFMRHYYDVYSLLQRPEVQAFIDTDDYKAHKARRFRQGDNPDITKNEAFILSSPEARAAYQKAYDATSALYYSGKPTFEEILKEIGTWAERL